MERLDTTGLPAIRDRGLPTADPLAEFGPERVAPIKPVAVRPAPRPQDSGRAARVPVAPAARRPPSQTRRGIWLFTLGSLSGALLCTLALYWSSTSEPPKPPQVSRAASEMLPAAEPPIVVAEEPRDPPVAEQASITPVSTPRRRDERPVVVPPPPEKATVKPFVGSLQIDSKPQGARVFIDRKEVGVTPVVVTDLVAGSHVVRLEAEGHTPWSSAIRVIANTTTYVTRGLAPSSDSAQLRP